MDPFHRFAAVAIARDASFVALAGGMLMVAASFDLALCFTMGANVALLFSLALLIRAGCLTEERLIRSEPWRALAPHERPAGDLGRRQARESYEKLLLRCAKSAAGNAIVLFAAALSASIGAQLSSKHVIETASLN